MKNFEIKNINCHAALAMTENTQSGRSMIEMLGVLAIIGVLSVGGIAGYSKAMQKYRINKSI
ncbi:MAG: prepilin-type N-terminal cleavage/methylation domain-containing protein, partial [Alphaproteobacteria bacterium]|nr:prepilin-type N-terminal cleavage/methylation domain-containing protein [Alphaproteobacteria bacterium]